ncbi:MAG: hypothetical protein ACJ73E_17365 [Mycobacteriales bacterium]
MCVWRLGLWRLGLWRLGLWRLGLWRRTGTGRAPGRCSCGSRRPWLRGLLVATGRGTLSGLVWLGLAGVALPAEAVREVRLWCAGPRGGPAPCCTAALPADCRVEDHGD